NPQASKYPSQKVVSRRFRLRGRRRAGKEKVRFTAQNLANQSRCECKTVRRGSVPASPAQQSERKASYGEQEDFEIWAAQRQLAGSDRAEDGEGRVEYFDQ